MFSFEWWNKNQQLINKTTTQLIFTLVDFSLPYDTLYVGSLSLSILNLTSRSVRSHIPQLTDYAYRFVEQHSPTENVYIRTYEQSITAANVETNEKRRGTTRQWKQQDQQRQIDTRTQCCIQTIARSIGAGNVCLLHSSAVTLLYTHNIIRR